MKIQILFFSFLIFVICQIPDKKYSSYIKENICILTIGYELTYNNSSFLKVVIQTYNDILSPEIKFKALLKSENNNKEYNLDCYNTSKSSIECFTGKNITFDLQDKYYFYYNRGEDGLYTLDEKNIFQDDKNVSLIFKPEMYENQIIHKDNRKILGLNNRKMVGGGYLYLVPNNKKLLHKSKDGFNGHIDKNNFISHAGLYGQRPQSTYSAFAEAIRRGFHMVDADIQFTKDKIPVIFHGSDISQDSNGTGKISSMTLDELNKLDFGAKFDIKYSGEKILTFEDLLILCKNNGVIIDLDLAHLDYKKYFEDTDEYMKIIIDMIDKYDMMNSIIFNDGPNPNTVIQLKKVRNNISVSISNMNTIENINKTKGNYSGSKRVILNMGGLTRGNKIDEQTVKYALSLGYKVKAAIVDDLEFAKTIQKWGVNYITTNKLHPFCIQNEYEEPILLKCTQFDILVECILDKNLNLTDNQVYNIYYSDNIYSLNEDINPKPIGEIRYIEANKLEDYFYNITYFNFTEKKLHISTNVQMDTGENIKVSVGPKGYDNISECYFYYFLCKGNNASLLFCDFIQNVKDRVEFEGEYSVHKVENFSVWLPPEPRPTKIIPRDFPGEQKENKFFIPGVLLIISLSVSIIFTILHKSLNDNGMDVVKIV